MESLTKEELDILIEAIEAWVRTRSTIYAASLAGARWMLNEAEIKYESATKNRKEQVALLTAKLITMKDQSEINSLTGK